VERVPTYYLPWLGRPGLECTLLLNNVEARFKPEFAAGPFAVTAVQHDADGRVVRTYACTLADTLEVVEVALEPTPAGHGFVTVDVSALRTDLYVTLSDGRLYTATHGRGEFVERYPWPARALHAAMGAVLGPLGHTLPVFRRGQYLYDVGDGRSHLLLLNLSNITNRVRVAVAASGDAPAVRRLATLPPMGARLLPLSALGAAARTRRVVLEGNAWFNLYLVGAGRRDVTGPPSLMHVK
jgi:hypothetical protein